jgi:glycosyltransferase involved in cell wall biosynthesis
VAPSDKAVDAGALTYEQIVFCVQSDDLASGRSDARAAAGLGQALADRGHGVAIVNRERWRRMPASPRLVVSLSPAFDPATISRDVPVVAWIVDQINVWSELKQLSLFDAVLTTSRARADRLGEVYPGPVWVLPTGVDSGLFRPHPVPHSSDTVIALDEVEQQSYFTLPDLYRNALVVVDQIGSTRLPFGAPIARLLECVACGTIPVTSRERELAEVGLAELPVFKSAPELDRIVRELRANPLTTIATGTRLAAHVRTEHSWERRADVFLEQVRPLLPRPHVPHSTMRKATLGFFPDFRQGNPYQTMLYADLPAHDVAVAAVEARNVLVARDPGGRLDGYLLHLHWTGPLLQSQPGPFGAELALRQFRQRVDEFRARGGRLVWTIHNVLPHECQNRLAEIQLCQFLADRADLVHVMSTDTERLVAPLYQLPTDRTVVIPHASYLGIYPDVVSRSDARRRLGLQEHEIALLMLGGIRPYKGLGLLLDVFDELSRTDPRLRLLVVGKPTDGNESERWRERCERHPRIVAHFAHAADADLQTWYRASDLAVLPYVSILNSGAFQLALSFDLPVVGARDGSLAAQLDPAFAEAFTPGSAADLRRALTSALNRLVGRPAVRRAAHVAARKYPPEAMARDFTAAVLPLLATWSVSQAAAHSQFQK